jgi:hypothetical protein
MAAPRKPRKQEVVQLHDPDQMNKIAKMAYHLWEKRGRPHGSDMQDWLEAERIVMGVERGKAAQ